MRVWGEVTFDGKPLADGSIIFSPIDGTQGGSVGGAVTRGRYELSVTNGPMAGGKYRLEISALRPVGKPLPNIIDPAGPPLQSSENYIPAAYNVNSTLTAAVSDDASRNRFDFALLSRPPSAGR
jgi:hypothetical protein